MSRTSLGPVLFLKEDLSVVSLGPILFDSLIRTEVILQLVIQR